MDRNLRPTTRALAALLGCLTMLGTMSPSGMSVGPAQADTPPPSPNQRVISTLIDVLDASDVAARGAIVSVTKGERRPPGGCGHTQESPLQVADVRVRVADMISGVARDSMLDVTILDGDWYPSWATQPGTQVLIWGNRLCIDDWRLWGDFYVVTPSAILPPSAGGQGFLRDNGYEPGAPISADAIVEGARATSALGAFVGGDGVAMVRLHEFVSEPSPFEFTYTCDSLDWVYPSKAPFPTSLHFVRTRECQPEFAPGDTLLVPVHGDETAGDYSFTKVCPRGWKVAQGYCIGFGVSLDSLPSMLTRQDGKLGLRHTSSNATTSSHLPRGM